MSETTQQPEEAEPVIELANDSIPRAEKQLAYEIATAATRTTKAQRRLLRAKKPTIVRIKEIRFAAAKRFVMKWKHFCIVWKLIGSLAAKRAEKAAA